MYRAVPSTSSKLNSPQSFLSYNPQVALNKILYFFFRWTTD